MNTIAPAPEVIQQLADFFHRNGYIRWPNDKRRAATPQTYKKGYEIRLVAQSVRELRLMRQLLRASGFSRRHSFDKGRQRIQPIYGREEVLRFLALIGWDPEAVNE